MTTVYRTLIFVEVLSDGPYEYVGHHVVVVTYGDPPHNVAVECEDCNEVLMDFDEPEEPCWDGGVEDGSRYGR